jgi:general secretion pathway protein D
MVRLHVLGLMLIGGLGFAPLASAQDDPPARQAVDPFDGGQKNAAAPRQPDGHRIELSQPPQAETSLEERLEGKGNFQAEDASLKDFAAALGTALDVPVVLAAKKLEEAAISIETPMYYRLRNVRVQTALRLILTELGLTYVIDDNVLLLTTSEDASSQLATRVYDCRELMKLASPIQKGRPAKTSGNQPEIGTTGLPAQVSQKKEAAGPDGGYEVADLMEVITGTVWPDSWEDAGGPGSIKDFKGLITISQTREIHEQVEQLLNMLHKAGGLEEKVKVSR